MYYEGHSISFQERGMVDHCGWSAITFFFLNQQFIIRHAEINCDSYFVTMYRKTKLHEGRRNDKEEEKIKQGTNQKGDPRPKERNKLQVNPSSTQSN